MCKKGNPRYMDRCIVGIIRALNKDGVKTLASCCGHRKYPMTIVCLHSNWGIVEYLSGKIIPRKKRFYKKDKKGFYYIPEIND